MARWTDAGRPSLTVTTEKQGRWLVFRLQGELMFQNCDELAQALDVPADDTTGHSLAVDAFNLEFFDSSGIRCLLSAARRVRSQGGKFVVLDTGRLARRIRWMNLAEQLPVMAALPA